MSSIICVGNPPRSPAQDGLNTIPLKYQNLVVVTKNTQNNFYTFAFTVQGFVSSFFFKILTNTTWFCDIYVVYVFRLLIQAKLLQSSKVSGVYSDKPAHPEDEGDMPQKNRYCTFDLDLF